MPKAIDYSRYHEPSGICPVTGKERVDQYQLRWSRHDLPGPYNACPQCDPDNEFARLGTGGVLRRLNNERAPAASHDRAEQGGGGAW